MVPRKDVEKLREKEEEERENPTLVDYGKRYQKDDKDMVADILKLFNSSEC